MGDIHKVVWGKRVAKQLEELPEHIQEKFIAWARAVRWMGLRTIRMQPGFHDEPLSGDRKGQRSIRLNRAYRAIYVERLGELVELVEVIEVNKHDY